MAACPNHAAVFDREKTRVLQKTDLSRKGSVDAPIRDLVEYINVQPDYYTTSSCSGRTVVFYEEEGQRKKGCHWLLVSHDHITIDDLTDACTRSSSAVETPGVELGYTLLKFEPFVLHVMCRSLQCAQEMLQASIGSGFRNSGITCGKKGKVMLAVRSTQSLEVPVCHNGEQLVTEQYLCHLVKLCNQKFSENMERIDKFYQQLKMINTEQKATTDKVRENNRKLAEDKPTRNKVRDEDVCLDDFDFESLFDLNT